MNYNANKKARFAWGLAVNFSYIVTTREYIALHAGEIVLSIILKKGDFNNDVIICFGTNFKLSVDLIQLLKVIMVLGFTLRHCHKLFVEQ